MPKQKRYIPPEEWKPILVLLAYGVTKNPALASCMQYAKRKYEASLNGGPVAEANRILEGYTLEGGRNAMLLNSSNLIGKK